MLRVDQSWTNIDGHTHTADLLRRITPYHGPV